MFENSVLVYSGAVAAVLVIAFLMTKFRTSYIKSLFDKINSQEEDIGKLINQLATLKTMNQNLESTIKSQSKQVEEMAKVNTDHSDKLSASYVSNKELIQDLKLANEKNDELEKKVKVIKAKFEHKIEAKTDTLEQIKSLYKKVNRNFDLVQKSNDNLREERDFYRQEFMKLRKKPEAEESIASNVTHIKTA